MLRLPRIRPPLETTAWFAVLSTACAVPCLASEEESGPYNYVGLSGVASTLTGDFDGKTVIDDETLLPTLGLGRGLGADFGLSWGWFAGGLTGRLLWHDARHNTPFMTKDSLGFSVAHPVTTATQGDIGLSTMFRLPIGQDLRPFLAMRGALWWMTVPNGKKSGEDEVTDAMFDGWSFEPGLGLEYSGLFPIKADLKVAVPLYFFDEGDRSMSAWGISLSLTVRGFFNNVFMLIRY